MTTTFLRTFAFALAIAILAAAGLVRIAMTNQAFAVSSALHQTTHLGHIAVAMAR